MKVVTLAPPPCLYGNKVPKVRKFDIFMTQKIFHSNIKITRATMNQKNSEYQYFEIIKLY